MQSWNVKEKEDVEEEQRQRKMRKKDPMRAAVRASAEAEGARLAK